MFAQVCFIAHLKSVHFVRLLLLLLLLLLVLPLLLLCSGEVFVDADLQRTQVAVEVLGDLRRQVLQHVVLHTTQNEWQHLRERIEGQCQFRLRNL